MEPSQQRSPLDAPYRCGWCYVTRVYRNPLLFDLSLLQRMEATTGGSNLRHPDVFFLVLDDTQLTLYTDELQTEAVLRLDLSKQHQQPVTVHPPGLYRDEVMMRDYPLMLRPCKTEDATMAPPPPALFLYAASGMEKEDWFLALRHAQRGSLPVPPDWPSFAHSLAHPDWLSGLASRLLYQVHRSGDLVRGIRSRLQRRLSHVQLPSLLGPINLYSLSISPQIPRLTEGRWHGVGHAGEMNCSFQLQWEGELELRLDTDVRWWGQILPLSLRVRLRRLSGRLLLKIKPPPSDRLWFGFYTPPELDLLIEPIVASRALNWTAIHGLLLGRVQAALANYLVLPHMDELVLPVLQIGEEQWGEEPYPGAPIPPCFGENGSQNDLENDLKNELKNGLDKEGELSRLEEKSAPELLNKLESPLATTSKALWQAASSLNFGHDEEMKLPSLIVRAATGLPRSRSASPEL